MPAPLPAKAEIDLSGVPATVRRRASPAMIIHAVRLWAKFGPPRKIAQFLNIPVHALVEYTHEDWWRDLVRQLRGDLDLTIEQTFGRLGAKALAQLEDRLTFGEHYINRMGERARRPLTAKELADIVRLAAEKGREARAMADGRPIEEEETEKKTDLEKLADLLRAAAIRTTGSQVIDVTPNPVPPPENTTSNPATPANLPSNIIRLRPDA